MNINRETLKLYWEQSSQHKISFFLMLSLIPTGAAIIDSALPYFLSQAIGVVSDQKYDNLDSWLWLAAGVGLIGSIFNLIGFRAMAYHESRVMAGNRQSLFEKLIQKDSQFFANQKIGAMTSRYIDFVRSYVTIQDLFIIRTLGFILTVTTGLILLLLHSWLIALLVLVLIVALIIQIRWSVHYRRDWRHERKKLVADIHGSVADALSNNLIVRTFAHEKQEMSGLAKLTSRFTVIFQKEFQFITTEGSIRVFLMVLVQIMVIIISVNMIRNGTMGIAAAVFILAYMQRLGSQLFVLSDIINGYDRAFLEAQPMTEMLLTPPVIVDTEAATSLTITSPTIDFNNVSYHYSDSDLHVIKDLSITIPAGQKIGLVGHSGAGKSTLVQLLLRFSDVTSGAILIDGQDIRSVTQASLRSNIAYVPQEPLLFHRSLRENIAYGKINASDKEILAAAKKAHALEFIVKLPNGLDTMVGERGVKLSGGQRQRIAIARAILKDAPILVLDEATSALDSESEKLIQQSLETLMQGRTSIVIAHRLSTIAKLDRIIVLDGGKIIEDGSHGQLITENGVYATLWKHQSGGFIEE